jgi:hypothetical protein
MITLLEQILMEIIFNKDSNKEIEQIYEMASNELKEYINKVEEFFNVCKTFNYYKEFYIAIIEQNDEFIPKCFTVKMDKTFELLTFITNICTNKYKKGLDIYIENCSDDIIFLIMKNIFGFSNLIQLGLINDLLKYRKSLILTNTFIKECLAKNKIDLIKIMIENGMNINQKDKSDETLLLYACKQNNKELITLLLEHKADVNVVDIYNNTPMKYLLHHNNVENINLLKRYQNIKIKQTPKVLNESQLHIACRHNKFKNVIKLLQNKCDIGMKNSNGETPLHIACKNNNIKIIMELIKIDKNQLYIPDNFQMTPISIIKNSKMNKKSIMLLKN